MSFGVLCNFFDVFLRTFLWTFFERREGKLKSVSMQLFVVVFYFQNGPLRQENEQPVGHGKNA